MLKTKCFILGITLPSSLQANGGTYCPSTPVGAIVRKQKLDKERHEIEQIRCRKKHRSKKKRNRRGKKQKDIENKSNVRRKVDETYPNKITCKGFYGNGALMMFLFPNISPESREILTKCILKSSLYPCGKLTDKHNEHL